MKKTKKFESGGSISDDIRARAMRSVEGLEGIKGSAIEDETGTSKGSIKRNEYGDLYDSEMKTTPKATPKVASKPYSPKSQPESDREENSAWMRQFRKDEAKAATKAATKAASKPIPVAKGNSEKTGFELKKEKALGMKMGGKVSSASSRADGCATKGKTKGRFV